MKRSNLACALFGALFSLATSLAHAAAVQPLEGRLETSPGSGIFQAYYDPNLNVTWAADANGNSILNWSTQQAWAAGLTIGGVSGWRLPSADVNGDGTVIDCTNGGIAGCADNELGFLYWEEGITALSPAPFSNVGGTYWSATTDTGSAIKAWAFHIDSGAQNTNFKSGGGFAWAVRSGDVSAVPVPAAVWLFGSGLIGLLGVARRQR